ncbi:MAG: UMP kinase [Patescibacteria group bacterium]|nr:UMP kinase [Patescibacteria group bacterium]
MPQIKFSKSKPIIISVGGSLVVPNGGPDDKFLKKFDELISSEVKKGRKFVLVVGGGKTARHYIDAAKKVHQVSPDDLDWLGIHATRLNGHLLRTIFRKFAHPVVIKNPMRMPKKWQGKILVAAGWKPGWSTDYVAARIAKQLRAESIINASNIDHVYTADPGKDKNAEPIEEISWKEYRRMVGDKWDPGLSAPFDPVASRFCHKNKMSVAVVSGEVKNLAKVLREGEFKGTIIL